MKILRIFFALCILFLLISPSVSASNRAKNQVPAQAIDNLLEGIKSDNFGLKLSAAYYLGEYNCEKAVIPLLKMLKSDSREEARISAALALYKIDDARGIFAVKQAIRFDNSERVKKLCALFYNEHSRPHKGEFTSYAASK